MIILFAMAVLMPSMARGGDPYYDIAWAKNRVGRSYDTMVFHNRLPDVGTRVRYGNKRTVTIYYPGGVRIELPQSRPPPVWVERSLRAATEGLVFYAALSDGNMPAIVAVTAIALLGGETGSVFWDVGRKAFGRRGKGDRKGERRTREGRNKRV